MKIRGEDTLRVRTLVVISPPFDPCPRLYSQWCTRRTWCCSIDGGLRYAGKIQVGGERGRQPRQRSSSRPADTSSDGRSTWCSRSNDQDEKWETTAVFGGFWFSFAGGWVENVDERRVRSEVLTRVGGKLRRVERGGTRWSRREYVLSLESWMRSRDVLSCADSLHSTPGYIAPLGIQEQSNLA